MPELVIFTAPKPFTNPHIAAIQRNAIRSWKELGSEVEVLVVGDEEGAAEAASAIGVVHIPAVERNEEGTPLVSSIFTCAREYSQAPLLAYVNADILLLPDFLSTARRTAELEREFLIVGQRWDIDQQGELEFAPGWQERLVELVRREGKLHVPAGSDYFIFPRDCFQEMPPFAIGRAGWDNWMIYHSLHSSCRPVDATQSITAIHQNHDYSHLPGGQAHYRLAESDRNRLLAGGKSRMYNLLDVPRVIRNGRFEKPAPSLARSIRRLELLFYPQKGDPTGWRRYAAVWLRQLRARYW